MGWLIQWRHELRAWGAVSAMILFAATVATARPSDSVHGRALSQSQMSSIFGDVPVPQCWDDKTCDESFPIYNSETGKTFCQFCDDGQGGGWFEYLQVCCSGTGKQKCNPGGGGGGACKTLNIYYYTAFNATLGSCGECGGLGAAAKSQNMCSSPNADGDECD